MFSPSPSPGSIIVAVFSQLSPQLSILYHKRVAQEQLLDHQRFVVLIQHVQCDSELIGCIRSRLYRSVACHVMVAVLYTVSVWYLVLQTVTMQQQYNVFTVQVGCGQQVGSWPCSRPFTQLSGCIVSVECSGPPAPVANVKWGCDAATFPHRQNCVGTCINGTVPIGGGPVATCSLGVWKTVDGGCAQPSKRLHYNQLVVTHRIL